MRIRSRLAKLERIAVSEPERRLLTQIVRDGVAKPTDEEVDRQMAEWEAEGMEPRLIQVQIVRAADG